MARLRGTAWIARREPFLLGACAGLCWLVLAAGGRPQTFKDSEGYLALADALQRFEVASAERPDRAPGYPLFLLACRGLAAPLGLAPLAVTSALQTLLLAGLGTSLVYAIARRASGRRMVALAAAFLYAADVDLHMFAPVIVTEALTSVLALAATWCRLRDGHWRRAAWLAALLVLTRPYLVAFPLAVGLVDGVRARRWGAAIEPTWPAASALAGWLAAVSLGGGQALDAYRRINALHAFGTAYEADLWATLPPGPTREVLADARRRKEDAHRAAMRLTGSATPWNPGSDWRILGEAAAAMIRSDPTGYVRTRLAIIPAVYGGEVWPRKILVRGGAWPPLLGWWHAAYRSAFYGSFLLFALLLGGAVWNGLDWPGAVSPMRQVIAPYVVVLLTTTAALSLATYEVGRLGVSLHAFVPLLWALALTRLWLGTSHLRAPTSGPRACL